MDESDRKILDLIRDNARMSFSEIGSAVGISRVSVKKRMTAMEEAGIIKGYHTVIDEETISNIRINDYSPANTFYNQTQAIRQYYEFADVDVDRYMVNGDYTQIFLSGREIDEEKIRKGIRYTIDIEAIPEEYAEVVKTLLRDRELEEIYSTTGACRIHCIGRSVNSSTMESHVNYLFNHTKGIRKIGWHILMSDLKAEKGGGDGTEKENSRGI